MSEIPSIDFEQKLVAPGDMPLLGKKVLFTSPRHYAGSLASLGSKSSATGTGSISRSESVSLVVAAIVTQILPNGNMVISGTQEVRVNYEKRLLTITGVVRPEDISASNIVKHTQIAEARIAYGGAGVLSDVQQPRYGQQLFDVIFPF